MFVNNSFVFHYVNCYIHCCVYIFEGAVCGDSCASALLGSCKLFSSRLYSNYIQNCHTENKLWTSQFIYLIIIFFRSQKFGIWLLDILLGYTESISYYFNFNLNWTHSKTQFVSYFYWIFWKTMDSINFKLNSRLWVLKFVTNTFSEYHFFRV